MDDLRIPVKVKCYAGYRGEQTPTSFVVWQQEHEVVEILDQWLAPDHRYFKLTASNGATYILRHDQELHEWELTYFSKIN